MITLDTVKRHVTHILGKLGAANRTQAVTRARELGCCHRRRRAAPDAHPGGPPARHPGWVKLPPHRPTIG